MEQYLRNKSEFPNAIRSAALPTARNRTTRLISPFKWLATTDIAPSLKSNLVYISAVRNYVGPFFFRFAMASTYIRRTDGIKTKRNHRFFFPKNNRLCLIGLDRHPDHWLTVVDALCDQYNAMHAKINKCCGIETSKQRRYFFGRFFKFAADRFSIDPRELKTEHVYAYYHYEITRYLNDGVDAKTIEKRIANELSNLKFFASWIGKPNCIPKLSSIKEREQERLKNVQMSEFRSQYTDPEELSEKIENAFEIDSLLGLQVYLMASFGLRPREAVSMQFSESFLNSREDAVLYVFRGTKNGKHRKIMAKTSDQRQAFRNISDFCAKNKIELFRDPALTAEQALRKLNRQLTEELDLKKETFNGSAYSFRHSFAGRSMSLYNDNSERNATEVSEDLGHHKAKKTATYIANTEKAGPDLIGHLLKTLAEKPNDPLTGERLNKLLRELLNTVPLLGLSVLIWCAKTSLSSEYISIVLRAKAIGSGKFVPYEYSEMKNQLGSFSTKLIAGKFLSEFGERLSSVWLEKKVLAPFDATLLSES